MYIQVNLEKKFGTNNIEIFKKRTNHGIICTCIFYFYFYIWFTEIIYVFYIFINMS